MKNLKNQSLLGSLFSTVRTKVKMTENVVTLRQLTGLWGPLIRKFLYLSIGRPRRLAGWVSQSYRFANYVWHLQKHHGMLVTIKWLKACHVCLQRALAHNPVHSLRDIEPSLPLPRTINGYPGFIPRYHRMALRKGDPVTCRFWLGLFSLYRALKVPEYKLKTSTITDEFTGDHGAMINMCYFIWESPLLGNMLSGYKKSLFGFLPHFAQWQKTLDLGPRSIIWSRAASPSNRVAAFGFLTDAKALWDSEAYPAFYRYICLLKDNGSLSVVKFLRRFLDAKNLVERLPKGFCLSSKKSWDGKSVGQLSLKEEAAGKLRVFALVDMWTQSLLAPLHKGLFEFLKGIPNDGTFDQNASVRRCSQKAKSSGCAYSFDLTAATDRLPAQLSWAILDQLIGIDNIGEAWLRLLVDREYFLAAKAAKTYGLEEKNQYYKYKVGQPMGAKSSWAMLAITHHWILQYASYQLGNHADWNTDYEILGDDLVVFNAKLASKYLEICKILGVEINLSKSIISPNHGSFEFAKRTVVLGTDVSPVSFKQLISGKSLSSRLANAIYFAEAGLVKSPSTLAILLTRFFNTLRLPRVKLLKALGMPTLSALGHLVDKDRMPLKLLVESLVNPRDEEFSFENAKFDIPIRRLFMNVSWAFSNKIETITPETLELSDPDTREEMSDELEQELTTVVLHTALAKAKALEWEYEPSLSILVHNQYDVLWEAFGDPKGLPGDPRVLRTQIANNVDPIYFSSLAGLVEDCVTDGLFDQGRKVDVSDLVDEVYDIHYRFAKYPNLSFKEALMVLDKVESYAQVIDFNIKANPNVKKIIEVAPIITMIKKTTGRVKFSYWKKYRPGESD